MTIQSATELERMQRAGKAVSLALEAMRRQIRHGITTEELALAAQGALDAEGAHFAPKLIYGFPGLACISVNDEIVHGIPGPRTLCPGDVVKIDVTAEKDGFVADGARTVVVPPVSRVKRRLVACTRAAFHKAIQVARAGYRICDIGRVVEDEVRRHGFTVVESLAGHGVGRTIHEDPVVPNVFDPNRTELLCEGMVLALEPIVSAGGERCFTTSDGWTVRTADGSLAAHHENTVVITRGRPLVLTAA